MFYPFYFGTVPVVRQDADEQILLLSASCEAALHRAKLNLRKVVLPPYEGVDSFANLAYSSENARDDDAMSISSPEYEAEVTNENRKFSEPPEDVATGLASLPFHEEGVELDPENLLFPLFDSAAFEWEVEQLLRLSPAAQPDSFWEFASQLDSAWPSERRKEIRKDFVATRKWQRSFLLKRLARDCAEKMKQHLYDELASLGVEFQLEDEQNQHSQRYHLARRLARRTRALAPCYPWEHTTFEEAAKRVLKKKLDSLRV